MQSDKYEPKTEFDINSKTSDYIWSMNNFHYHNSYEIYFLSEGGRKMLIADRIYELSAGNIILIKPNVFHRSMADGCHTRLNIEFTYDFMRKYFTKETTDKLLSCFDKEILYLDINEQMHFKKLFDLTKKEYDADKLYYITFMQMLKLLYDTYNHESMVDIKNELSKSAKKVNPIIEYINQNYATIESIEEIADACYINKSYMCRLFKKETDMTVVEYINHIRIHSACQMLTVSDKPLTEIALSCGFSSPAYFSSMFKSITKYTPSEFRKVFR